MPTADANRCGCGSHRRSGEAAVGRWNMPAGFLREIHSRCHVARASFDSVARKQRRRRDDGKHLTADQTILRAMSRAPAWVPVDVVVRWALCECTLRRKGSLVGLRVQAAGR
jgi:hypothetical protein